MSRQTSHTIISAYRATSVVDTPMRKVEILEQQNGSIWLRETTFDDLSRAHCALIHLEHHESQALAKTLLNLEDQPDDELVRGPRGVLVTAPRNGDAA